MALGALNPNPEIDWDLREVLNDALFLKLIFHFAQVESVWINNRELS